MKIVIEIPNEEYSRMKEKKMFGNVTVWKNAICNGTPLPKGHGRIADIDKVLEEMRTTRTYDILLALERVKPIIEADKEG